MVQELVKGVHWVGVVDWGLKHFHGFELSTHRGSAYNSFLIMDDHIALVDTVWAPFTDQFIENVRKVVDPSKIEYVVVNHSEPDHSGALPAIMRLCPDATVVVSKGGSESVPGYHHGQSWKFKVVRTGDRLNLGSSDLMFVEAPLLHWPDSMFTYLTGKNILMPNDAFGQHYATASRFNDEVNTDELYQEAIKYYANILSPFSTAVIRKIDELLAMNLPIDMILPSHGVLWRKEPLQIVKAYRKWAEQVPDKTAVILYDTMWEATRKMAEAIGEGLMVEGIPYKLFYASVSDRNDVLTELFKAKGIIVGSPTINRGYMPSLAPIMEELKGMGFKNKVGAIFGSYGWSGESVKLLEEHLTRCKIPLVSAGVRAKWQPTEEDLEGCRRIGREVGAAIKAD
jgi:anaerobic nitric oxide reductase flavorubredoxin